MRSERRGMAGTLRAPRYFAALERFQSDHIVSVDGLAFTLSRPAPKADRPSPARCGALFLRRQRVPNRGRLSSPTRAAHDGSNAGHMADHRLRAGHRCHLGHRAWRVIPVVAPREVRRLHVLAYRLPLSALDFPTTTKVGTVRCFFAALWADNSCHCPAILNKSSRSQRSWVSTASALASIARWWNSSAVITS